MFLKANTGHSTNSGIATNGTCKSLEPNWLVLEHLIKTTKISWNTLTSCLISC